MACAFAGEALACSWALDAADILIEFAGMFRVMGLLAITACEVSRNLTDDSLTVLFMHTKTSDREQVIEKAVIKDLKAAALLLVLCSDKQPGEQVFSGVSPKQLRAHFRQLAVRLGLGDGVQEFCRPCTEVLEEPAGHGIPCGPQQPKPVDVDPVCEVCLTFARVPYGFCSFCGAKPSYHHGRCCVRAPDWGYRLQRVQLFFTLWPTKAIVESL